MAAIINCGDTVYDPWHYVPVLARKPGALRNGAPFKDWVLPAAMERVRRKLAGDERRCDHRADAWHLREPPASFMQIIKLSIKLLEPEIEAAKLVEHAVEKRTGKIRQFGIRDGSWTCAKKRPAPCGRITPYSPRSPRIWLIKAVRVTDDAIARAMKRLQILLSCRFDRHKPHRCLVRLRREVQPHVR